MRTAATKNQKETPASVAAAQGHGPITFITIPCPPSVNALYRNVARVGRVKTSAYKDWAGNAGWILKSQNPTPVVGRVLVVINIQRPSGSSDLDNRAKAILDLLVTHKVIKDDKYVTALAMAWAPKGTAIARVAVLPATDLTLDLLVATDGASGGWFITPPNQEGPPEYGS